MRSFLLPLVVGLMAFSAHGQGVGFAPTEYATGTGPTAVVAADFNGDGKLDLAVANNGSDSVSIFLGNGNGTFGAKTDFATGAGPSGLAVGDFNGDGKLDLAVANQTANTISILLGKGDGTFGAKVDFATGATPLAVAVGDFNGDNKLDVVSANRTTASVSILLGNGDGTLRPKVEFVTGTNPAAVLVGDFNGDGKLDVATANSNSNTVSILNGNGDGTFGPKTDFPTGNGPVSLAKTDFNGDGPLDLVTANVGVGSASVLLGKSGGGFNPKTDLGTDTEPIAVTAADFNADGKADFLTANIGYSYYYYSGYFPSLSLRLGKGDGTFGNLFSFALGSVPGGVATGDFNSDGRIDLAIANPGDNKVMVLLQSAELSPNPGSLDFGNFQAVGIASAPQSVTVQSTGSFTLTIGSVTLTGPDAGDFSTTADTCSGKSVVSGSSCSISAAFTPSALGAKSASLVITDNAPGSPHSVALMGAGVPNAPIANLSPPSLDFGSVLTGGASPNLSVSIGDVGGAPLNISSITVTGDFTKMSACSTSLTPGATCNLDLQFRPTATGNRTGTLTVNDNAAGSPHSVALTGNGTDFSISAASGASTSATVKAGQTATYVLNFAPTSGFSGTLTLTCSGAPSRAFCIVSPSALPMNGILSATTTVTVTTTAPSLAPPLQPPWPSPPVGSPVWMRALLWLLALMLLTILVEQRPRRQRVGFAFACLCLCAVMSAACGGGGSTVRQPGTPPGTYPLTISASSNGAIRTFALTLTVTP